MMSFDELISNGELTKAARLFAKEYYDSGKMGHTRKLLIEMLADKCDKYDKAIARQSVKSEEVAEAIPVVRCKECGYYDTTGYPALNPSTGWCDKMDRGVHDDFYCSYGERRK